MQSQDITDKGREIKSVQSATQGCIFCKFDPAKNIIWGGGKNVKIKRTENILFHFSPLLGEKIKE